jgi:hypothetical protein
MMGGALAEVFVPPSGERGPSTILAVLNNANNTALALISVSCFLLKRQQKLLT